MNEQKNVQRFDAAVLMNLPEVGSELRQWWIDNPSELQKALIVIGKIPCPELKIWKTIKLGAGFKNADDFRKAIKDCGMRISDWANDIIGKPEFTVNAGETEVDLVKVTVAELGFKDGARRDQIYERAKEFGLELCPSEVGPQLRLQYKDQPLNEWILIGMEPIRGSDGDLDVFNVEHYVSGIWLVSDCGSPGDVWGDVIQCVFVRPRKCQ